MRATMQKGGWVQRLLEVHTDEGWFLVEYDGRGVFEYVRVNGEEVARDTYWYWFAPRFDFRLGRHPAVVEVRMWPWMVIRSFRLTVGDEVLYAEGWALPELPAGWQDQFAPRAFQPLPPGDARLVA